MQEVSSKLTLEYIQSLIGLVQYHRFPDTTLTVCNITLTNGCNVLGKSDCISISDFDAEIGQQAAYNDAVSEIWELEGYAVKRNINLSIQQVNLP